MSSTIPRQCIEISTGISIELELTAPDVPSGKLAVLLHPWSRVGGGMDDRVLYAAERTLLAKNHLVLRFNSRGVGRSSGWASFSGTSEAQDLQALTGWAIQHIPDIQSVLIVGYSHGSLISSLLPVLPTPVKTDYILISYPLGVRPYLTFFSSGTYADKLSALVKNPKARVLVVYGTQDEFTGVGSYDSWVRGLEGDGGQNRGRLSFLEGRIGKGAAKDYIAVGGIIQVDADKQDVSLLDDPESLVLRVVDLLKDLKPTHRTSVNQGSVPTWLATV